MDALVLLSYGNAAGELLVFGRLAHLRIILRYKWFAVWMAFSAGRDFAILLLTSSHLKAPAFWTLWQLTEPVALGLEVLVVFEVFDLIAQSLLGLEGFGIKFLKVAGSLGIVISVALAAFEWRGISPWLFEVKRTVTLILAIVLMCVSWVFLWVSKPLPRNLVYHCRILTLYLSAVAAGYFLLNVGLRRNVASVLFLSVCLMCLILWTIFLSRDGEDMPTGPSDFKGPRFRLRGKRPDDRLFFDRSRR